MSDPPTDADVDGEPAPPGHADVVANAKASICEPVDLDAGADPSVPERADVIVVGAGPAGSALAALLARRGIDVVLLERDAFPRDKLCGEFLSPEAGRLLAAIGCRDALAALAPPVLAAARFTLPSGFALDVPLPGEGWGLSRRALDAVLASHAATSGARLLERTEAVALRAADDGAVEVTVTAVGAAPSRERRVVRAGLVVAAYGRSSRLDRATGRRSARRTALIGLKRHLRLVPGAAGAAATAALAGRVEMHAFRGGYCGLTVIETGEVNACMLVHRAFVRAAGGASWAAVAAAAGRANPALGDRLAGLAPADDVVHAVAQVSLAFKDRGDGRRLFVGDAAGMIAPLAGDGQAVALEGAVRLADLVAAFFERGGRRPDGAARERLARAWDAEWRGAFGRRLRLARALQPVLLDPRFAEPAARVVAAVPGAGAWLARRTRGSSSPAETGRRGGTLGSNRHDPRSPR